MQLFPFGSVPLKTYLPDGDIDLTALSSPNAEESLCGDVYNMLEAEEHNQCAEFKVKDVQYIHAEVLFLAFYFTLIIYLFMSMSAFNFIC